jgi:hypothetical protein
MLRIKTQLCNPLLTLAASALLLSPLLNPNERLANLAQNQLNIILNKLK